MQDQVNDKQGECHVTRAVNRSKATAATQARLVDSDKSKAALATSP